MGGDGLYPVQSVATVCDCGRDCYKGAAAFIALQLMGLTIAGLFPSLVNYLPNRTYLTSDTAPPPMNPRLQACLEDYVFGQYDNNGAAIRAGIESMRGLDISILPESYQEDLGTSLDQAAATFALVEDIRRTDAELLAYQPEYRPMHEQVRKLQADARDLDEEITEREQTFTRTSRNSSPVQAQLDRIQAEVDALKEHQAELLASIPAEWDSAHEGLVALSEARKKAISGYRRSVDGAYEPIAELKLLISQAEPLAALGPQIEALRPVIANDPPEQAMETIKLAEGALGELDGVSKIKSSRARRALKDDEPDRAKAEGELDKALTLYQEEISWRQQATDRILPALNDYDATIRDSIGLRMQKRLTTEQAEEIAACQSIHRDISLNF